MNLFEEIKVLTREKSGKKLAGFSVIIFLLLTVIVLFFAFEHCKNIYLNLMEEYLGEIPRIFDSYTNELLVRSSVFEEDVLSRAELGIMLYKEENGQADMDMLEKMREAVSASSITLLDGQGKILLTTGPVSPDENFNSIIQSLKPRDVHLELYPVLSEDGKETGKFDGKGFVMIPLPENSSHSLVYEFPCDTMLSLYNYLGDWSNILKQTFYGDNASAFAKTGENLVGYSQNSLTPEETSQLNEEVMKVFQNSDNFRRAGNRNPNKLITLLGDRYLATLMHFSENDTDILMDIPLKIVIRNGIFVAVSISVIIGLGMVMLQIYVFRRLLREKIGNGTDTNSFKWVFHATWPGILVMVAVTVIFSSMLLLLENRTNASYIATAKRESLQSEIDWRKNQEKTIRNTFSDIYRTQAQMLGAYLTEHPDQQTHAGLEELNQITGSEYLMRFDKDGQELASSNSYTGFSVGKNISEEYRAVLLGYPYAVVGPEADPYTNNIQIGAAILMTDKEGQPDGFLLAVYSAEDLNSELKRMSYENTINNYAVKKGQIAAAISEEDGRFIAHTDPKMIGLKAANYLEEDTEPGKGFEGFTTYKGKKVCASASTSDGKTLLFMVPERGDANFHAASDMMILAVLLILALLYCPQASVLIAKAMGETKENLQLTDNTESPIEVYFDGYIIYMTLFAILAWIASSNDLWSSFTYVFSGNWSRGVHLFSIWKVLFVISVTLFCEFMIKTALSLLETRISIQSKTITRLAKSFIFYVVRIFLVFYVLYMFGVNTTALLASAGVISLAIGMGAQSMAADLLAGFFMMLEGSVHVGDHVSVSGVTGHVTDMGIRTTEITDDEGNVVVLNNSKVTGVRNMSRKSQQQDQENAPK